MSSTEAGSFVLNQLLDCYGNQINVSDFSGPIRFTFNPGGSDEEILSATGFTLNSDGTVTVNAGIIRGLAAKYPYTAGSIAYNHPAGTPVIVMPDNPQLFEDILTYIDGLVLAAAVGATDAAYGYVKTTENLSVIPRVMSALVSQKAVQPSMVLTVQPFAVASLDKDVTLLVATDTPTMVAPVSNPRIDLVVYDAVNTIVTIRTGSENALLTTANYSTYKPIPTTGDIVLAAVFHRVGETKVLERDDGSNGFVIRFYTPEVYGVGSIVPAGAMAPYAGRSAPSGWLFCDGSAVSRVTYPSLLAAICPSQTFTVTIASPGVFTTLTSHGLVAGDKVHLTTTGGLPSGLAANTNYYVLAAGLTSTAFQLALSPAGTAVVTTGSQNGTHTVYKSAWGKGDGATTFNLPDFRGKSFIGLGASSNMTLDFEPGAVNAGADTIAVPDGSFPVQGQAVTLTTTGTLPAGLATSTTYYVIRISSTSIKLASSQANADAASPSAIDITNTGSGVHTIVYATTARTVLGGVLGEETHAIAVAEFASHTHAFTPQNLIPKMNTGQASANGTQNNSDAGPAATIQYTGGDAQHNNIQPAAQSNIIIKT
jgi:microcystin-dependent protein